MFDRETVRQIGTKANFVVTLRIEPRPSPSDFEATVIAMSFQDDGSIDQRISMERYSEPYTLVELFVFSTK